MGGGASHKKLLKKHYIDNLFSLIKAYKRYYLGIWILKLPFYKVISNKVKTQKWQEKRKERYEFLNNALKKFKGIRKLFLTFAHQMKIWLNSKEFKEKYLDTNHPYPPLLNPETIDYESIPAELAWEWNLPLPKNYNMIYIFAHGAGVYRFRETMLNVCNLKTCYCNFKNVKNRYFINYDFLIKSDGFNILEFDMDYKNTDFLKLLSLVDKKVPILCQVRDPIELLKHALARIGRWDNKIVKTIIFDSTFEFEDIILPLQSIPFNRDFEYIKKETYPSMFHINANIKGLQKNITDIAFLDTRDINSDNIISKFNKITQNFNFIKLEESQKTSLQSNAFKGSRYLCFPLYFYANPKDIESTNKSHKVNKEGSFKITITHSSCSLYDFDLYEEIMGKKNEHYGIYILKRELLSFRENKILYSETCKYLREFIEKLELRFKQEDDAVLKINDIMEYLKNDAIARKHIYEIIKDDVAIVRKYRPDIVESWHYYKEFEAMCAELDKK